MTATDISEAALSVASVNATRHQLADRVELVLGSWCAPLAGRTFDIVVANPPYIPTGELAGLARDVRDHEPVLALDGGTDGLDAYRELLPSIATVLADGGWSALEIDTRAAARSPPSRRGARAGHRHADPSPTSPIARGWCR